MKKVHVLSAVIGLVFGIISVIILIYLRAKGVIAIVILWTLVPVLIKKVIDKVKTSKIGKIFK